MYKRQVELVDSEGRTVWMSRPLDEAPGEGELRAMAAYAEGWMNAFGRDVRVARARVWRLEREVALRAEEGVPQ